MLIRDFCGEAVFSRLLVDWPLHSDSAILSAWNFGDGTSIGYTNRPIAYFEINIVKATCYLIAIGIDKGCRGQGHGEALYRLIEKAAAELGCDEIRQTPSGHTFLGEPRMEWLVRRGWEQDGDEVFKRIGGA